MTAQPSLYCQTIAATHATADTLVCLHGWGFDHRCWQPLVPFLQTRFNLVLVDLPGFGQSACVPADQWLVQTQQLLNAKIDELAGSGALVYVLGWSLGGQLALQLSVHNRALRAVFALAANLQFAASVDWPNAMAAEQYENFLDQFAQQPSATLKRFGQLVAAGASNLAEMRKQVRELLAPYGEAQQDNWLQALWALQRLDLTRARFERPAHLLLAQNDHLVPATVAQNAVTIAGLDVQLLSDAGHSAPLSHPEQVARWLLERT